MASQNLNVGTSANSNDGDTLRAAFIKLKQMFAEVYGQTYSEQGDLSGTDFKINESKLQLTASGTASDDGKVLTYDHATGGFSLEDAFTGTIGDITGIVAGDGLTGLSLSSGDATLNVVGGTGITVAADSVSLATSVQDEITANTAKTGITATQAGHITTNNAKVTNATHTGDVSDASGVLTIADNVVNATKLDVTGDGTAGQLLQSDGDGSMTWVTGVTGDVTGVAAGDGLTGGGTGGDLTLTVGAGDGITVAADTVSLAAGVAGDGLTLASGVLSVDTIQTGDVADDAITSPKLAEFDDTFTAGTSGDIIVSNGTDFIHATMSGDATIVAGGAITIADDAVDADKLADSINTDIATGVAKVSFPGFGTTAGTSLEGDTALLQLGTSSSTALAGDTALLQLGTTSSTALAGDTSLLQLGTTSSTALAGDTALLALGTSSTTALVGDTRVITAQEITDISNNNSKTSLEDDAVDYDKLADEFTTSAAISALDVDFSSAAIFTKTLSATTTLTFSNVETGMVKTLVISGNQSLVLPSGVTILNGAYSGTATKNVIQIVSTNGSTEMFATVSNV